MEFCMALARNCIWISITDAASARQSASVELERSAEHLQAVKLTNADGLGELHLQISVQAISMHTAVKTAKDFHQHTCQLTYDRRIVASLYVIPVLRRVRHLGLANHPADVQNIFHGAWNSDRPCRASSSL